MYRRKKLWVNLEAGAEEVSDPEKCTRQSVPNVSKNAKFHSSLHRTDPSTAKNAS